LQTYNMYNELVEESGDFGVNNPGYFQITYQGCYGDYWITVRDDNTGRFFSIQLIVNQGIIANYFGGTSNLAGAATVAVPDDVKILPAGFSLVLISTSKREAVYSFKVDPNGGNSAIRTRLKDLLSKIDTMPSSDFKGPSDIYNVVEVRISYELLNNGQPKQTYNNVTWSSNKLSLSEVFNQFSSEPIAENLRSRFKQSFNGLISMIDSWGQSGNDLQRRTSFAKLTQQHLNKQQQQQ
jgi:hypothetical protein